MPITVSVDTPSEITMTEGSSFTVTFTARKTGGDEFVVFNYLALDNASAAETRVDPGVATDDDFTLAGSPADFINDFSHPIGSIVTDAVDGQTWTFQVTIEVPNDGRLEGSESFKLLSQFFNGANYLGEIVVHIVDPLPVSGTDGSDSFTGEASTDSYLGLGGDDALWGNAGGDLLDGGSGSDDLYGGTEDDALRGGPDSDRLWGQEGDDQVEGGTGDDLLHGDDGADYLGGGFGNDAIFGGSGTDVLLGQGGDDKLFGGDEDDRLDGGAGRDSLRGGTGNEIILSGSGDDGAHGGVGNDQMAGGSGLDRLRGDRGDDLLLGGNQDDRLSGGAGRDWLVGGSGSDWLSGGADADRFDFDGGQDVIVDFANNRDLIVIDRRLIPDDVQYWEDFVTLAQVSEGSVVIDFDHGNVLTIRGLTDIDALQNDLGVA